MVRRLLGNEDVEHLAVGLLWMCAVLYKCIGTYAEGRGSVMPRNKGRNFVVCICSYFFSGQFA